MKNIHVIFNEFSRKTLLENKELNLNDDDIISLQDDLRVGPISDLKSKDEIQDRKKWFSKILRETSIAKEITSNIEYDIKKIGTILNADKQKAIYSWTGKNALDIIGAARLISKLIKHHKTIFITDFNQISLQQKSGNSFSPKSLVEVNASQIHKIFSYFEQIDAEQFMEWDNLWKKINTENSLLRIIDKNENINSEKENYYDNLLVSFCTNKFQKPAIPVAHTLIKSDFGISDWFLNWRLKKMSAMKRIATTGTLKDLRDYQIKTTTLNNVKPNIIKKSSS